MLLTIDNLQTVFDTPAGRICPVDGLSLAIPKGHSVALVGESGCGKSLTALSILRLVPPPGRIASGRIVFQGRDLCNLGPNEMRTIRGNQIAMIFQEPMSSLNPLLTVGAQIGEALRLHRGLDAHAASSAAIELLRRVLIPDPTRRVREFPHQMSGGMRQRVMIAMALACDPTLLLADEPTTALDVTVQAQIITLLRDLQRDTGMSMLFITHDLGVVAQIADTVCVMYAGRIVEQAPVRRLFADPQHPYTQGLRRSTPRIASTINRRDPLPVIPGEVPTPLDRPTGCPFHPRCELGATDARCQSERPPLRTIAGEHDCACWKAPGYPVSEASLGVGGGV